MERKPFRQQHDLDRHHRHGAPRNKSEQSEHDAREHVRAFGAAAGAQRLARAAHVVGIDRVADHLEREIGLHGRADVEIAVAKQRPAAMRALDAAQIDGDLRFERGIDRLAEIVPQQHVFGRNGGVGLKLEHPMPVRPLAREQGIGRGGDRALERGCASRFAVGQMVQGVGHRAYRQFIVAIKLGRPVAGPYRAFDRRRQAGCGPIAGEQEIIPSCLRPGPFGVLARQCGESGPPFPHDLPRGQGVRNARDLGDFPPDQGGEFLARRVEQPVGAADGDRQTVGKGEQPFGGAVDDAGHGRERRGRLEAEMRVDDGAKFGRRRQVGNERCGDHRRHREDNGIARRAAAPRDRRNRARSRGPRRTSTPAAARRTRLCRRSPR